MVILEIALLTTERPDLIINLDQPDAVKNLEKSPFVIKERALYRVRIKFRVQHEIISGLRYLQLVKKAPLSDKTDEMMVSLPRRRENPRKKKKKKRKEGNKTKK